MEEERLIQPGDPVPGEQVPPTYNPGNLPPGPPIEAVKQGRTKFYGPVSGPFACVTREDTLQVTETWSGYIAVDVNGFTYPVALDVFEQTYETVGPGGEAPAAERSPLWFVPDLEQLQEVDPALRLEALLIQYRAAFEEARDACVQAGIIPAAQPPADELLIQPEEEEEPPSIDAQLEEVPTAALVEWYDGDDETPVALDVIERHLRGRAEGGDDAAAAWVAQHEIADLPEPEQGG